MRLFYIVILYFIVAININAQCDNEDFEEGTLRGWEGFTGEIDKDNGNITLHTKGMVRGRHTIMEYGENDPIASRCGMQLPTVAPGGRYSVRLGNPEGGWSAESIRKTITVTKAQSFFLYKYAVVLEDPGHDAWAQPRFEVKVYDQNGASIPCGEFGAYAGANAINDGFVECTDGNGTFGSSWWVKPWHTVGVDLAPYIGQDVTLEFVTADCAHGGHGGYAYIEASCQTAEMHIDGFCPGATSLTAIATEGFSNYLWSNGETTYKAEYKNPKAGDVISVKLSSVAGCDTTLEYTLPASIPSPILHNIPDTVACYNNPLVMTATGENISYFYWPASKTRGPNYTFNITQPTQVEVWAYDLNGCNYVSQTFEATTRDYTYALNSTKNKCPRDDDAYIEIDLNNTTGKAPYEFRWSNGATGAKNSNLVNGEYILRLIDDGGKGCTKDTVITIEDQGLFKISGSMEPERCDKANTGKAIVNVDKSSSNSFNYVWAGYTNADDTLENIPRGVYEASVYELTGNKCWDLVEIPVDSADFKAFTNYTDPACNGVPGRIGASVFLGEAPFTYFLNNVQVPADSLKKLLAGVYDFKIEDKNGCSESESITLVGNDNVKLGIAKKDPLCAKNEGSITASIIGGSNTVSYDYKWSTGSTQPDIDNLSAGKYTITVEYGNGKCSVDSTVTLNAPSSYMSASFSANKAKCNKANGSASVSVSGGNAPYVYKWINNGSNQQSISNLGKGYHKVEIQDAQKCLLLDSVFVDEFPNTLQLSAFSEEARCDDPLSGMAYVKVVKSNSTNHTFIWDHDNTEVNDTIKKVSAGVYKVKVEESIKDGCWDTISIQVPQAEFNATFTVNNPPCENVPGSIDVNINKGTTPYSYFLNNKAVNASAFDVLYAGEYDVEVKDNMGCNQISNFKLISEEDLKIDFVTNDPLCSVSDGSVIASIIGAKQNYNYQYLWSNGSIESKIEGVSEGAYKLTVSFGNQGCVVDSTIELNPPGDFLSLQMNKVDATCEADNGKAEVLVFGGKAPYSYNWIYENENGEVVESLGEGYHTVEVIDANNCIIKDSIYIDVPINNIQLDYKVIKSILNLETGKIELFPHGGFEPYKIVWLTDEYNTTLVMRNIPPGDYPVKIVDEKGCVYEETISLEALPPVKPTNALSPNGDGVNDVWHIDSIEEYPQAKIEIYTRWGRKVFETQNYEENKWAGLYKGDLLPEDTYFYVIDLNIKDANPILGYVDLIK